MIGNPDDLRKLPVRGFDSPELPEFDLRGMVGEDDFDLLSLNEPLDIESLVGERPRRGRSNLLKILSGGGLALAIAGALTDSGGLASLGAGISRGAGLRTRELDAMQAEEARDFDNFARKLMLEDIEGEQADNAARNNLIRDALREDGVGARQRASDERTATRQRKADERGHEFDKELEKIKAGNRRRLEGVKAAGDRAKVEAEIKKEAEEERKKEFAPSASTKELFKTYSELRNLTKKVSAEVSTEGLEEDPKDSAEILDRKIKMFRSAESVLMPMREFTGALDDVRNGFVKEVDFEQFIRARKQGFPVSWDEYLELLSFIKSGEATREEVNIYLSAKR